MNDQEAIAFFQRCVISTAREMPLSKMLAFLHGALLVGGEHAAMEPIREAYVKLGVVDAQLELIASPQMKLRLDGCDGGDGAR